jgi:hypothetical protein
MAMKPIFRLISRRKQPLDRKSHNLRLIAKSGGQPDCSIPTCDLEWRALFPPVVPSLWRCCSSATRAAVETAPFTTVANWTAYGAVEHEGRFYGQKDREFLRFMDLPSCTSQTLELALAGAEASTIEAFRARGWSIRDAGEVTTRFGRYRDYVACSRGELSAAKHAYVATHSGWFSDRSVCYLAAGRPVILQDTGFGQSLPTGRGLLAFTTLEEALDCIERVNADYQGHCSAARQLASDFLHFQKVLGPVLEIALST